MNTRPGPLLLVPIVTGYVGRRADGVSLGRSRVPQAPLVARASRGVQARCASELGIPMSPELCHWPKRILEFRHSSPVPTRARSCSLRRQGNRMYRAKHSHALWSIYQMIGKCEARVYVPKTGKDLRRSAGNGCELPLQTAVNSSRVRCV